MKTPAVELGRTPMQRHSAEIPGCELRLITGSRLLWNAFMKAFGPEGAKLEALNSCEDFFRLERGQGGIVFLDLERLGANKAEELRGFLDRARGVSIIAVCDPARTSNTEMAALLAAGADDIVPATMDPRLLAAKTRAHLKRLIPALAAEARKIASGFGEIEVDRVARTVTLRAAGKKCRELSSLTPKEFALLCLLLARRGEAVSRADMLSEIWGIKAEDVNPETVDRHIESLRKKLCGWGRHIKTIYSVGYILREEA